MAFAEPPGWYVISLRPQGGHDGLRRAAAAQGAGLIALSPWRIQPRTDDAARHALRIALSASRVVFTSPASVKAASGLSPLRADQGQTWIGVGAGTARALVRAGVRDIASPARMDSEGLLALDALQDLRGISVGLVTAPGGRDVLSAALQARGATVQRADVYSRQPVQLSAGALRTLAAHHAKAILLLSSQGALRQLLGAVSAEFSASLRALPVVAASERLQAVAQREGFADTLLADGPLPAQMIAAAARRFR